MRPETVLRLSLGLLCLVAGSARAEITIPPPGSDPMPPITVGTAAMKPVPRGFELIPQISILSPSRLELRGANFTIPYSDSFAGVPAVQLGVAIPLGAIADFDLALVTKVGYSSREGLVRLRDNVSGVERMARQTLLWVPVSSVLRASYRMPGVDFVRPSISLGGGVQLLHHSGHPGATDTFVLPFVSITPALTFLEGRQLADWFGGFTFGTSYVVGLSSEHVLRGWSFDLSVNLFL